MDHSKLGNRCLHHKPDYVVNHAVKEEAESVQRKIAIHISTIIFKAKQTTPAAENRHTFRTPFFSRDAHDSLQESFDNDDEADDGWTESSLGSNSSPINSPKNRPGSLREFSFGAVSLGNFPEIGEELQFYNRFVSTQVSSSE